MSDADDRPDSGVFLVQQALAGEPGRRASDRAWDAFLTGPWPDLKRELRRHYEQDIEQSGQIAAIARVNNEQTMQLGVIRGDVSRIEANQLAVLDEVFGQRGLDGKRKGGLAALHADVVLLIERQKCAVKGVRVLGLMLFGLAGLVGWGIANVNQLFALFRLGVGGP